ncbi:aldose 1-epimerase family protein [Streptacidiphilus sp. P02-A3a]|uniref:aldose 1-epimerase family protein n=1 Tax=Streptacidiphilus sp. P02-A3a TaxID=2704468 RepID=UPI0015FD6CE6|nr:aldose 1-epimerase family protein [Streptacidiphilus sp. P02-A3a]QMU67606.1 aldose 1-epimerase family protein [Streptacidiphilus sp. P02-A3a]
MADANPPTANPTPGPTSTPPSASPRSPVDELAPSGPQQVIEFGDYRAVLTGVGAGLRALSHRGRPLVLKYPQEQQAPGGAGQLLIPWPNRVRDGRYQFDGHDQQLDLSEPTTHNASHGFVRFLPWRVMAEDAASVRFGLRLYPMHGYPHLLDLTASYRLDESGLSVEVTARNVGRTAAPYGIGAHPYATLGMGPGSVDEAVLELPADTWIPVDERLIPVGRESVQGTPYDFRKPRVIGGTKLDTAYTGLLRDPDGRARVRLTSADGSRGVELWVGEEIGWLQLYSADGLPGAYHRAGVAVEPMSCPPNAFATGEDVLRLEPGERVSHHWGIKAL